MRRQPFSISGESGLAVVPDQAFSHDQRGRHNKRLQILTGRIDRLDIIRIDSLVFTVAPLAKMSATGSLPPPR